MYLYDLFKGQGKTKHHRSLRRNHLLINGIVEMGHLQRSNTLLQYELETSYNRNET